MAFNPLLTSGIKTPNPKRNFTCVNTSIFIEISLISHLISLAALLACQWSPFIACLSLIPGSVINCISAEDNIQYANMPISLI